MSGIIAIVIGIILYAVFWLFVYVLCMAAKEEDEITGKNT